VLLNNSAVCLNGRFARDGRPLPGVVDETNVDGRVFLEVVGLARLGIGVEEDVEAVCFLFILSLRFY
jgi:hypothetical protein